MSDTELCEPLRALAKTVADRIVGTKGRADLATFQPDALLGVYAAEEQSLVATLDEATRAVLARRAVEGAIASLGFAADPSRWRFATNLAEIWHVSPFERERAVLADWLLADGVVQFGDDPPCRIDVRPEFEGPVTRNLLEAIVDALGAAADGLRLQYGCVHRVDRAADAYATVYASNLGMHFLDFEDPASLAYQQSRRVLLVAGLQPRDEEVRAAMDALLAHGFVPVGLASIVDPVLSHGGHPYLRYNLPFTGAFAFHQLMEHYLARGVLPRDRYDACLAYHRASAPSP